MALAVEEETASVAEEEEIEEVEAATVRAEEEVVRMVDETRIRRTKKVST